MSTVVYRDGVLAADSRAYGGSGQPSPGTKRKLQRLSNGDRVGVTTAVIGMAERWVAWLEAGAVEADWKGDKPDLRAILIKPNGDLYLAEDALFFSGPISSGFFAIGSGSGYATGALAMGASAAEAVAIAIRFDHHSGGPVEVLEAVA